MVPLDHSKAFLSTSFEDRELHIANSRAPILVLLKQRVLTSEVDGKERWESEGNPQGRPVAKEAPKGEIFRSLL